jgi:uncharacterized membrane protein YheB (UPF0754 family)
MIGALVAIQGWNEIKADVDANLFIYLSMPFVAAFVGWSTKIVAIEMLYRPVEFKGIGPIGWQGIVPRRAGKVGAKTIELLTTNLLKPEELLENFDAREAIEALREPLARTVEEISYEFAEKVQPGLWDSMPERVRAAVMARIHAQLPQVLDRLMADLRHDLSRYVDVQFLAVTTLVRNKDKLNRLMRGLSVKSMVFMRRSGIVFGLGIGLVQMVAWAVFHNPWIMPAFGFAVGFFSDYVAINMLFRPIRPKKYLGLVPFQGILHAEREGITRDYARILADDLFSPEILFDGILKGPGADKLFALMAKEISAAVDAQSGPFKPVVRIAVGTARYNMLKASLVDMIFERLPETMSEAHSYAKQAIDLENTIVEKMNQLTDEEYESILRPVFKDDEPLVIAVGATLGGLVGELQVQVMERLGTH